MNTTVPLGVASVDITPKEPIPLAGFAFRTGPFDAVRTPLTLRCFLFRYPHEDVVVLSADLLWWGHDTVAACRSALDAEYGTVRSRRYLFVATHTHCGPQVCRTQASGLGKADDAYINRLTRRVVKVVGDAAGNVRTVRAVHYRGCSDLPINRRCVTDEGVVMAPNPSGPRDTAIHLVEFMADERGASHEEACVAVWVCAACHPTTTGENRVDPEFLARGVSQYVKDRYPHALGCFLQGCCGDTRPAIIQGNEFYRGTLDRESEDLARRFCHEVAATRDQPAQELAFPSGNVVHTAVADLPLASSFPHARRDQYLNRTDHIGEWARYFGATEIPATAPLALTLFRMSDGFSLLLMDGEIMSEYALFVERVSGGRVWAGGYCNGMTAYVPSDTQIVQGGYEPYESMFYLLRPAPFAVGVEQRLKTAMSNIVSRHDTRKTL